MIRFLSLLLLLPLLAACGDDDPAGPDRSHVGVYQLKSVSGMPVPVSFEEEGEVFTINSAALTLSGTGTFTMTAQASVTVGGQTTPLNDSLSGTYTRSGNSITFDHVGEDEGFETATLSGDVLTTSGGGGEVLIFEK